MVFNCILCGCVNMFVYVILLIKCIDEVGEDSGAPLSESELKATNVMYTSSLW